MRRLSGLLVPALLAGCVSVQEIPLAPSAAESLRGRETTIAVRDRPDFGAFTPGRAAIGGLVGAAIMIEAGNRVVENNNIHDPSLHIAQSLAAEIAERYQVRLAPGTARIDSDDVAQVAKAHPQADLLLDVRTINWSYVYYPTSWNRYRVIYSARLRLIDAKRAQVIAEGMCARVPDDVANAPTGDELLANGAQRLKAELGAAADFCVQHFRTATFAFGGPAATTVAAAAAAAAPPPSSAASSVAAAAPVTGMPQQGDSWTYRLTEPMRADGPKQRNYVVKVAAASPSGIVEHYAIEGGEAGEWTHKGERQLIGLGKSLYAPYLLAFGELPNTALGRPQILDCGMAYVCEASARVVGWEKVRVPAGVFDAVKVEVRQSWRPGAISGAHSAQHQGGRNLLVWYARETKRAVKFSSRATFGGAAAPIDTDFDLELENYRLR